MASDTPGPAEDEHIAKGESHNNDSADVRYIVDVFRALVDQEFRFTERISTRARQALIVASALVTLAQSVAFGSFRADQIGKSERLALVGSALLAIAFLVRAGVATVRVDQDETSAERDVNPVLLAHLAQNMSQVGSRNALSQLSEAYTDVLNSRRDANRVRAERAKVARIWVSLVLLVTIAEVIVALLIRL